MKTPAGSIFVNFARKMAWYVKRVVVIITISNAKSLMMDMYYGVKYEFLQAYLNEFCYKFNRRYIGERLMIASVLYRPTFKHRTYGTKIMTNCG